MAIDYEADMKEVAERAAWRTRLVIDVLRGTHDKKTIADMVDAGLNQAHREGVEDAIDICDRALSGAMPDVAEIILGTLKDFATKCADIERKGAGRQ